MDAATLYGKGLGFPPRLGADGRVAWSDGPDNIRECIRVILGTDPGERVMLPAFGAGLRRFLHEPNTATTHRLLEQAVDGALRRWEPRIAVESIVVTADPADRRRANVTVDYRLVATGTTGRVGVAVRMGG
jgi:uncharacterized protein